MSESLRALRGVPAIAEFIYGSRSVEDQRRVRRLIQAGALRTKQVAGRYEALPEWCRALYDDDDEPKPASPASPVQQRMVARGVCLRCHGRIWEPAGKRGRPPRYHDECRPGHQP